MRDNFCHIADVCRNFGIDAIDGVLMDLGVSSYQVRYPRARISYQADASLDMRMDRRAAKSAYTVVNTYPEEEIKRILFEYGEERYATRIAARIAAARADKPIETTGELVGLIKSAIPAKARKEGQHPAKRSFQAIRIEVNAELDVIAPAIEAAADLLNPGGRIAVITFHSLEDRIVKQSFARLATGCTCPRDFPVCVCGRKPVLATIGRKPILPGETELKENPRARSAKLRIAEKLPQDGSMSGKERHA